jgi:ETC complex I subunit conserved region
MLARIFKPAKNAMQSGKAKTHQWQIEFAPKSARLPDPLMGWTESRDPDGMIRLTFETREEAVSYAKKRAIAFEIVPEPEHKLRIKAYADNFAFNRRQPWTH